MRYYWEGGNKRFIQMIKAHISNLRKRKQQLAVLMEKVLATEVLDDLIYNNPHHEKSESARLYYFKIYRSRGTGVERVSNIMEEEYISGISVQGKLYICFET